MQRTVLNKVSEEFDESYSTFFIIIFILFKCGVKLEMIFYSKFSIG